MQSTLLYKYGSKIAAALVEGRLDDGTAGKLVRICLQIEKVGLEKHLFKEFLNSYSLLC